MAWDVGGESEAPKLTFDTTNPRRLLDLSLDGMPQGRIEALRTFARPIAFAADASCGVVVSNAGNPRCYEKGT